MPGVSAGFAYMRGVLAGMGFASRGLNDTISVNSAQSLQ
jgi:hypothetical protein